MATSQALQGTAGTSMPVAGLTRPRTAMRQLTWWYAGPVR